jgi:hypothetical protein
LKELKARIEKEKAEAREEERSKTEAALEAKTEGLFKVGGKNKFLASTSLCCKLSKRSKLR